MPLYTYSCDRHGEFSAWGTMSECDSPQPCPSCSDPAPRALARPAIGGRSEGGDAGYYGAAGACGEGACGMGAPVMGGGCGCGAGGCVH